MRVVSTFSGVGGLDLGLERAGMDVICQVEADEWKRSVLRAHWPHVPCGHDVRTFALPGEPLAESLGYLPRDDGGEDGAAGRGPGADVRDTERASVGDLLCGGFPCQDLSMAGLRKGLAGDRSGLFFQFARIADALRPRWLLVENVPGLLTSNDGRDFAVVLETLAELGYGVAWRVLNARYFGVPQRRRRVFIVGHLGGEPEPALHALCETCEPVLEAGPCTWHGAAARTQGGAASVDEADLSNSLMAFRGKFGDGYRPILEETLVVRAHSSPGGPGRVDENISPPVVGGPGYGNVPTVVFKGQPGASYPGKVDVEEVPTLTAGNASDVPVVAWANDMQQFDVRTDGVAPCLNADQRAEMRIAVPVTVMPYDAKPDNRNAGLTDEAYTLTSTEQVMGAPNRLARRMTPVECERLMSWPDNWTAPFGIVATDNRRFHACGDGVVANVAEWIGRRILAVDAQ